MQTYAIKMFNFLRFGEVNNTIVFDLSEDQKLNIASGITTMDEIYEKVVADPITHIETVNKRGIESMLGITGVINGDPESSNGAGKSSVMEAMCYARYDRVSRKTVNSDKVEKAGTSVVTRIDGEYPADLRESYTEEIIEDNGKIYRIRRGRTFSKTQKTSSPVVEMECYSEGEKDMMGGHRSGDTKDAISGVINMDYDVFVNSQMFAQNDAGKFLMGTDKTKKEMLISLLRLEDVVSGCLDLVRTRKRNQDKEVTQFTNRLAMTHQKIKGIHKDLIKVDEDDIYVEDEYLSPADECPVLVKAIVEELTELVKNATNDIAKVDSDIEVITQELNKVLQSDQLKMLAEIKERGVKLAADKAAKEKELNACVTKWDTSIKQDDDSIRSLKEAISNNEKFISQKKELQASKSAVDAFDRESVDNQLLKVEKVKEAKPTIEAQYEKGKALRDDSIKEIASVDAQLGLLKESHKKFSTQLNKSGDTFLCGECESIVTKEHIQGKIDKIVEAAGELNATKKQEKEKLEGINAKITTVEGKLDKCREYLGKETQLKSSIQINELEKAKIAEADKDILNFTKVINEANTKIVACTASKGLSEAKKAEETVGFKSEVDKIAEALGQIRTEYQEVQSSAKVITDKIAECKTQIAAKEELKKNLNQAIGEVSQKQTQVEELKIEAVKYAEDVKVAMKVLERYKILESVYGLDGIQTKIIERYLPLLNVYIKEYLDILTDGEMGAILSINEKSKVDLLITGGSSCNYDMLSGGEKMVVRLATDIGLALLSFSRSSQKPELICLDEIFGPLDNAKIANVFNMLEHLKDKFSRVIIITHKQDIKERIPANIIIEKTSGRLGFSEIKRIE